VHTIYECSFAIHFSNMVHVVLSFYSWVLCHIPIQEMSVIAILLFSY